MYECKTLVWIVWATYIVIAVTDRTDSHAGLPGDKRVDDTDVSRHVTKTTSTPHENDFFNKDKNAPEMTRHDSMNENKTATNKTGNYGRTQILFHKRKHRVNKNRSTSQKLLNCCHMNALETIKTKRNLVHNGKTDKPEQNNLTKTNQSRTPVKYLNFRHQPSDTAVTDKDVGSGSRGNDSRKRRYAYEDNYDLQYDERFEYDDDPEETKRLKKYAKNWDKIGLRLIYLGSSVIMVTCICCLCCRKCCKIVCDTCSHVVMSCVDKCRCRDPMYRNIHSLGKRFGIEIDYATYKKLKQGYAQDIAEQGFRVNM